MSHSNITNSAHNTAPDLSPPRTENRTRFSVIIPALNEERVIHECLECLTRLDFPKDAFEVVLVDNGSRDRTLTIARSFQSSLNLTIRQQAGIHISALRNLGAEGAQGEFLAFLDADCLAPSSWLTEASALLMSDGCGVIGAHYQVPDHSGWIARTWYEHRQSNLRGNVSYVPAGTLLVSRAVYYHIGKFDETIQTNEDYEFCERARAKGFSVRAFPEIRVVHLGTPQTLSAFFRKHRWHGMHVLKVFLRDISSFRNIRPILFALYTLVCLIGVIFGGILGAGYGHYKILSVSLSALLLLPSLLGFRATLRHKLWADLLPLAFLFLIYGIARASSLLDHGNWISSTKTT